MALPVRRHRLLWSLSASYIAVAAISVLALAWYSIDSVRTFHLDTTERELQGRARLVDRQLSRPLADWRADELQQLIVSLGDAADTRFTIVGRDGVVLADSDSDPASMANHADRPEVQAALRGGTGVARRVSPTLNVDELYVALPLREAGAVVAAIRAAVPLTTVSKALDSLYLRIGLSAALIAVLAGGVGVYVSRRISRRMQALKDGAARFAAGDFSYKIEPSRTAEFGAVAGSLNDMARQLDATIRTITEQTSEREAILTSMVEGVLAVDLAERVIVLNEAAAGLLQVDAQQAAGRRIQEVVRNRDLQGLIAQTLAAQEALEAEILLHTTSGDRYLQVNCTGLRDADAQPMGALAVLNDVTRLKGLEEMRREFVANVSHEIKTPVTSIKGFAETLLDGALDHREDAERFARIIVGQADRLNSIVEDLLSLARVEQADAAAIEMQDASLNDVLQVAVEVCSPKAVKKRIDIELEAPEETRASISPILLEQAVVNLIDNAVKYSSEGTRVRVRLEHTADQHIIVVEDQGIGIAREHLPHLFERFYRVDKARSRALGGTGLGLAIVKHVAQVHGGSVSVDSRLGSGTTVRLFLPRR